MSKYNNVNPDHYKVAGRERPGDGILHERNKAAESISEHQLREQTRKARKETAQKQKGSRQRP